ncbi:HNH endonuclease [Synechococcus sp. AH-224-I15]|nr:HNH endonuclease [Synechococcus sp. AH-224-I15]
MARVSPALHTDDLYWHARWAKNPESRSNIPPPEAIAWYWADRLVAKGKGQDPEEFLDGRRCFACGRKEDHLVIQRAHIRAAVSFKGGWPHSFENLHLLCTSCHTDSEFLEGEAYVSWFSQMDLAGRVSLDLLIRNPAMAARLLLNRAPEAT